MKLFRLNPGEQEDGDARQQAVEPESPSSRHTLLPTGRALADDVDKHRDDPQALLVVRLSRFLRRPPGVLEAALVQLKQRQELPRNDGVVALQEGQVLCERRGVL